MSKLTHNKRIAAKHRRGHGKAHHFTKKEMRHRFFGGTIHDFRCLVRVKCGETKLTVTIDKNNQIADIQPRVLFDKYHGRPKAYLSSLKEELAMTGCEANCLL